LVNNGYYADGTLSVTITKNENWVSGREGTTEQYTDIEGRVILTRSYVNVSGTLTMLSTYNIYDDFGYLCFVLPPKSNPDNMVMTTTTYDNTCYQYWYDAKGRVFRKKTPGKGWDFILYNKLDYIGQTQDANPRKLSPQQPEYRFFLYDQHDERESYAVGRWFGGDSFSFPTYSSLPKNSVDISNHPNISYILKLPIEQQNIQFQRLANATRHAFRINGKTYYKQQ
jgi:hypothetical protein